MAGDPMSDADDSFHDPYDGPFTEEELFNIISDPDPRLLDLSLNDPIIGDANPPLPPAPMETSINVNNVVGDPPLPEFPHGSSNDQTLSWTRIGMLGDETVGNVGDGHNNLEESSWEMGGDHLHQHQHHQHHPHHPHDQQQQQQQQQQQHQQQHQHHHHNAESYEAGESSSMPVPFRPPRAEEGAFACNCCQPLRELIHTNGQEVTRLDIHGRIGMICHANLIIQQDIATSEEYRYQTFHFGNQSNEEVKGFLEQYCAERAQAGFWMVQDSLASFYQMMSIGLDMDPNGLEPFDTNLQNSASDVVVPIASTSATATVSAAPAQEEPPPVKNEQAGPSKEREKKKTPLAAQRERTGKLTLKDIGKYFHLPIEEAARTMKLCPTVVKKICRRGGLARWPHRKIKSVERKMSTWRSVIRTTKKPEERARAEAEIQKLEAEIDKIRSDALKDFD